MATIRNVSDDARRISYGLPGPRWVQPTHTVDVPDELVESYEQPGIWEIVGAATRNTTPAFTPAHDEETDE